jgi:TolB-like protein
MLWGLLLLLAGACGSEPPARSNQPAVIEVAPFTVLGGMEPWSGLGLAEQMRQALQRLPDIVVRVAADSARPAQYVLRGTVSRRGARNEIGVEVVRAREGVVIWSGTYWRAPGDLGAFITDLVDAVLAAIRLDEKRATGS